MSREVTHIVKLRRRSISRAEKLKSRDGNENENDEAQRRVALTYFLNSGYTSNHFKIPNFVSTIFIIPNMAPTAISATENSFPTRNAPWLFLTISSQALSAPSTFLIWRSYQGWLFRSSPREFSKNTRPMASQAPSARTWIWRTWSCESIEEGMRSGPVPLYFWTRYSWMNQDS